MVNLIKLLRNNSKTSDDLDKIIIGNGAPFEHKINRQMLLAEGIKYQSDRENSKIKQLEYDLAVKEGIIATLKGPLEHIKMIEDKYLAMERLKEECLIIEETPQKVHPVAYTGTKVEIKEDHFTVSQSVYQPAGCLGIEPIYQPMLREDKLCGNCGVPSVNYRKYPDAIKAYLKDGTWHIDVLGGLICVLPDRVIDQINEYRGKSFDHEQ